MADYNFWADLLSTFRASNDWVKALIVGGFYATVIAVAATAFRVRRASRDARSAVGEPMPTRHLSMERRALTFEDGAGGPEEAEGGQRPTSEAFLIIRRD